MEKRICSTCGEEKDLSEYYFRKTENKYLTICKTCTKLKSKQYRKSHKEYYNNYAKNYYEGHKGYFKNYMKENQYKYRDNGEYYDTHRKERQAYQREYYQKNKNKVYEYNRKYRTYLKNNNEVYRVKTKLSSLLRKVFVKKGVFDNEYLESITKMTNKELYDYLLKTFKNNYGFDYDGRDVHIDHINPLATAKTVDDVYVLNRYTNLQLLTPEDNMHKWKH